MQLNSLQSTYSALFNLNNVSNLLSQTFQSLASGRNANLSPAAGIQSDYFNAQLDSLAQASENVQDGSNLLQTAQGGLSQVSSLLQDIHTASIAAANTGVISPEVTQAYQTQIAGDLQAIQSIATQTQFNGKNLLDGSASISTNGLYLQTGANPGQRTVVSIGNVQPGALGTGAVPGQSLAQIDVTTPQGASNAIAISSAAISQVATQSANLGAVQSGTLRSTANFLSQQFLALSDTNARISDTDYGLAASQLTAQQVQRQAGLAVLSQANSNSARVSSLLG